MKKAGEDGGRQVAESGSDGEAAQPNPCPGGVPGPAVPTMTVPHDRAAVARYSKVKPLNEGTFGKIWVVEDSHDGGALLVCKEIKLSTEAQLDEAIHEASMLGMANHVNIIRFVEVHWNWISLKLSFFGHSVAEQFKL